MSESYKIYASKDYVDSKALPEGVGAYQQLVTNANSEKKWEELTHYKHARIIEVKLSPANTVQKTSSSGEISYQAVNSSSANPDVFSALTAMSDDIFEHRTNGRNYAFYWDGVRYLSAVKYYPFVVEFDNNADVQVFYQSGSIHVRATFRDEKEHTFGYECYDYELKQLDEEFIPESIARKTDLPDIPNTTEPHMQLVTGASSAAKWEERTHYKEDSIIVKLSPQFDKKCSSTNTRWMGGSGSNDADQAAAALIIGKEILYTTTEGKYENGWTIVWDGVVYTLARRRLPMQMFPGSYPFGFYAYQKGNDVLVEIYYNDDLEHTFEWVFDSPYIKKLDDSFVPDTIPRNANEPHMELISDRFGNTIWEKRMIHREAKYIPIVENITFNTAEKNPYSGKKGYRTQKLGEESLWLANLQDGETYIVVLDGIEYECTASILFTGTVLLGNKALDNLIPDTYEPFCFLLYPTSSYGYYYVETDTEPTEHTISVYMYIPAIIPIVHSASVGQIIVVKSVDENGKPTEWECVDPWVISSSTEGSTKQFKLTIDDEGTFSATEIIEEVE